MTINMLFRQLTILALLVPVAVLADGPQDNIPTNVRRVPKLGIEVPAARRKTLEVKLDELAAKIDALKTLKDPTTIDLLPDVEIYYKAVHDALMYQEFFDARDLEFADTALAAGLWRADQLAHRQAPWTTNAGLIVR